MNTTDCPLCEQRRWSLLYRNPGGWSSFNGVACNFYICEHCGLVARLPGAETMEEFYELEYWADRDLSPKKFLQYSQRTARKMKYLMQVTGKDFKGEAIYDVGCGFGHASATIHETVPGARVVGVEPGLDLVRCLQKYSRFERATFIQGTLETLDESHKGAASVIMLDSVFEHLCDPNKSLKKIREILRPGGYLLTESPEATQVGKFGPNYFFRDFHLYYYTLATTKAVLRKNGFKTVSQNIGDPFYFVSGPVQGAVAQVEPSIPPFNPADYADPEEVRRTKEAVGREAKSVSGVANLFYTYKVRRPIAKFAARLMGRSSPKAAAPVQ